MSETYPTVPSDLLLTVVDGTFEGDYTKIWGGTFAVYFKGGRHRVTVSLSKTGDLCMEAVTVGCLGRSLECEQAVWIFTTLDVAHPVPEPFLVMCYSDEWGTASMRRRPISIDDVGRVVGAGPWEDRPTGDSRLLNAVAVPWGLEPGDPQAIRQLLESRGHVVRA